MILAAAALAGFAVLAVEILGVFWLAPWFGTSSLVWSNQIGVVLLAMAAGGWAGGRRARVGTDPLPAAAWLLGVAGVLIALGLWLLPVVASALLPDGLSLDHAATVFLGGSLASALLLFAPPVFLLAMVSPLLVEARARQTGGSAGSAAGEVAAAGTLGSLAGVFGTSLLAIPFLGTRLTLMLTAAALVSAALVLRGSFRPQAIAPLLLCLTPALITDPAVRAHLPAGARVLAVKETSLQRLRVIEFEGGERWLQMNEGLDSFQSRWPAGGGLWPGGYYDLFALAPLYARWDERAPQELPALSLWVLGYAAGSALGPVHAVMGEQEWSATGVEIDAGLRALVDRWMPPDPAWANRVRVIDGADARALLHAAPNDLDCVLLDAYANQFEIPLHLATSEFFAEVAGHLREGGVLAINLGTSEQVSQRGGLLDAVRASLGSAFGTHLRAHQVARSRNWVVFARKGRAFPEVEELRPLLPAGVPASVAGALLPGQTLAGPAPPGTALLRDDRNPLAWAQARLWLGGGGP